MTTTAPLPLTRLEAYWASLVLPSFAGSAHGFTAPPDRVDYLEGLRRFLSQASDKSRLGIRVAFFLAVTAPLWLLGRFSGFAGLTWEERADLLDRMSRHRVFFVRELCLLLKLIACMAIFRTPGMREQTDYDPIERPRARRGLPVLSDRGELEQSGDRPIDGAEPDDVAARAAGGAR